MKDEVRELTLIDLLVFLRKHLVLLLCFAIVGLLLGFAASYHSARQWEAKAYVKVGQIGLSDQGTVPLEPPAEVAGQISLPPFQDQVLRQLQQDPANERSPLVRLVHSTLTGQIARSTNFVEIAARGYSAEQARAVAQSAQAIILATHDKLFKAGTDDLRTQLAETTRLIDANRKARADLAQSLTPNTAVKSSSSSDNTGLLMLGLAQNSNEENRMLLDRQRRLENDLSAARTFNSKALGDIVVPDAPVAPRRPAYAALGAFVGLFLGFLVVLRREAAKRKA